MTVEHNASHLSIKNQKVTKCHVGTDVFLMSFLILHFAEGKPLVHPLQVQYVHKVLQSRIADHSNPLDEVRTLVIEHTLGFFYIFVSDGTLHLSF